MATAVDNMDQQEDLQYAVCYSSNLGDIDTMNECETNKFGEYALDIGSKTINGLSSSTTYYINVLTKDRMGNMNMYNGVSVVTD